MKFTSAMRGIAARFGRQVASPEENELATQVNNNEIELEAQHNEEIANQGIQKTETKNDEKIETDDTYEDDTYEHHCFCYVSKEVRHEMWRDLINGIRNIYRVYLRDTASRIYHSDLWLSKRERFIRERRRQHGNACHFDLYPG